MLRRIRPVIALTAVFAALACSEHSVVTPDRGADGVSLSRQSDPAGSYVISFLKETDTGLQPASDSEPVGTFLVLKSEVKDYLGNPAQSGSVTYEYCSFKGNYAPSATCNSGGGSWRRLVSMQIDPVGQLFGFGSCDTPRTIGFRFTFSGRSSGIPSGVSASRDFTWSAT